MQTVTHVTVLRAVEALEALLPEASDEERERLERALAELRR